ncbi:MAG: aspartyl-tRNA synthetase, aspartyl-tRNA synthetase, partial [Candidatus Magasanikbacteria bacterium]|nr:aspartyl-tRNA synthetase, aspartyl-tRNA synthetase [Candidatus Magasanikbacteria bacterium]
MKRIYAVEIVGRVGESMTLSGWVHVRRNLGKIAFFDLRDRSGLAQIVCVPAELDADSNAVVSELRAEYCLQVEGVVQKRSGKQINPELPTGEYEVLAKKIIILNRSEVPPFEIADEDRRANEELRLKYRYLDLRHQRLQKNLELRHRVTKFFRDYLSAAGFWEIETPILTKGTPEGAREFLVPSRVHSGKFFVLPQSPQQFKQLLMVAGVEKYFQIARCFRDEDQRGDRQPEFTQLDMEMSFVEQEDIMSLVEAMLIALVKTVTPEKRIQQIPFPRIPYKEAMEKYGSDKPDIREDKNDPNLLAFCWVVDFPFFEKTEDGGWTFTHNP